jgi:hypothetical protein
VRELREVADDVLLFGAFNTAAAGELDDLYRTLESDEHAEDAGPFEGAEKGDYGRCEMAGRCAGEAGFGDLQVRELGTALQERKQLRDKSLPQLDGKGDQIGKGFRVLCETREKGTGIQTTVDVECA